MKTIIEALIVGIISMTVIYFLTGCSSTDRVLVSDCYEVMNRPTYDCSKKVK